MKDGKIETFEKKDDMMYVGGGKGKNKKKQKQPKAEKLDQINIDFTVISKFSLVGISPPTSADQLDDKLAELNEKMKKYNAEGEAAVNKDKEQLEKDIERMVDKDIEDERKAFDAEYGEEEEKVPDRRPKDEGYFKKQKGEFDDDEDVEDAYTKPPTRGGY